MKSDANDNRDGTDGTHTPDMYTGFNLQGDQVDISNIFSNFS